jgi:hypothetical protein
MRASDKCIANWMSMSLTTLYRWRAVGLLPHRPRSKAEALAMLSQIEAARDAATFARPQGQVGRTRLDSIHKVRGNQQWCFVY